MGRTHTTIAIAGALITAGAVAANAEQSLILVGGACATAKLPDIDVNLPLRHRGPATHSLLACILLAAMVGAAASMLGLQAVIFAAGVMLGTSLHVLADAMTVHGAPLLWPATTGDQHLLPRGYRVRTGKASEGFVLLLVLALTFAILWALYAR